MGNGTRSPTGQPLVLRKQVEKGKPLACGSRPIPKVFIFGKGYWWKEYRDGHRNLAYKDYSENFHCKYDEIKWWCLPSKKKIVSQ